MEVIFTPQAKADLEFWRKSGNKAVQRKIEQLIVAIQENPFEGIGKPEPLKHELSGFWSRRVNGEHRNYLSDFQSKYHCHSRNPILERPLLNNITFLLPGNLLFGSKLSSKSNKK